MNTCPGKSCVKGLELGQHDAATSRSGTMSLTMKCAGQPSPSEVALIPNMQSAVGFSVVLQVLTDSANQ